MLTGLAIIAPTVMRPTRIFVSQLSARIPWALIRAPARPMAGPITIEVTDRSTVSAVLNHRML